MFKVGDIVSRISYNNDVIFTIVDICDDIYYLKGVNFRLLADSFADDLKLEHDICEDDFVPYIDYFDELDRDEFFYIPGRILHIDADKDYLNKCMNFYKKNNIKAYGFLCNEVDISLKVFEYLSKYNPDILVLTGHDAYYRKKRNGYKNTKFFVDAVKEARKFEKSFDKLLIVAGACQSNYDDLIRAGANFASSPKKINIHALDPAIVASSLALSDKYKKIDLISILSKTKYGSDGFGGIITYGTMYVGFPRE